MVASAQLAAAEDSITLYENDFEKPNQPVMASCGNSLDQTGVNTTYGRPGYMFIEHFSVETLVLHDTAQKYRGQRDKNGDYALGMLGTAQDDKLAFRFDVMGQHYLNVAMDVSSIDVQGCGGPFGVEAPVFKLSLLDDSGGEFDWNAKPLETKLLQGDAAPDAWTFRWSRGTIALDASKSKTGSVIVVFDLVSSGYAVFDNLKITASKLAAVGDRDDDGVEDSVDNCPSDANPSQANADHDVAGDACDPVPADADACGDLSGDGDDDCIDWCDSHDCSGRSGGVGGRGGAGRGGAGDNDADGGWDVDEDPTPNKPSGRASGRRGGSSGGGRTGSSTSSKTDDGGCSVALPRGSRAPWAELAIVSSLVLMAVRRRLVRRYRPGTRRQNSLKSNVRFTGSESR